MVNINLYKTKKQKFSIVSVLVLVGLLLLPVVIGRLTIMQISNSERSKVHMNHPIAGQLLAPIARGPIKAEILTLDNEERNFQTKTNNIVQEINSIELRLAYTGFLNDFLKKFSQGYTNASKKQKPFLETLNIIKGDSVFVNLYDMPRETGVVGSVGSGSFANEILNILKGYNIVPKVENSEINFLFMNVMRTRITADIKKY